MISWLFAGPFGTEKRPKTLYHHKWHQIERKGQSQTKKIHYIISNESEFCRLLTIQTQPHHNPWTLIILPVSNSCL